MMTSLSAQFVAGESLPKFNTRHTALASTNPWFDTIC
jgi:hypothetical protein